MNEFEKSLERLLVLVIVGNYSVEESKTLIPSWSKTLIDKTRKQIASEIDKSKMTVDFLNNIIGKPSKSHADYYLQGIEDALKAIKGE